jgi:hypothetical protein
LRRGCTAICESSISATPPGRSTGRHYLPRLAWASRGEATALKHQMTIFRVRVTEVLDRAITEGTGAQILNFFEHRGSGTVASGLDTVRQVQENEVSALSRARSSMDRAPAF